MISDRRGNREKVEVGLGGGARKGERKREKERESCTVKVFESALVLDAIFRK